MKDEDEWLGRVRWITEHFPFTAPPVTRGALCIIPLRNGIENPFHVGIHVGSPGSISIFISIETYCYEADWTFVFAE